MSGLICLNLLGHDETRRDVTRDQITFRPPARVRDRSGKKESRVSTIMTFRQTSNGRLKTASDFALFSSNSFIHSTQK